MDSTAVPANADTNFVQMSGGDSAVKSDDRDSTMPANITSIVQETSLRDLYVHMVNSGNMIDIAASVVASIHGKAVQSTGWMEMASAVLSIQTSALFHQLRAKILSPFIQ